ncbi:pyruvate dehydrogenase (acetyl-transferring) E1 component subunit alpha [Ruegeria marisrubri]|uniref:Pyruvate dehydrogenase E1 component subunit alpha n=1 Tax=Ruegeria marisrubri TaxID=1685379 RepID=A0A0X3UEY3_9RHOB|nr:pyruvate dehydrogenase (acetyl-transferring) E1 component subunit alpha [Ruegeria marisrubri]KUJ85496.1 pyruvate dehydrogenase (acetyl-transferring) E1 component subunit alpha [Ruegeria marisrubri]
MARTRQTRTTDPGAYLDAEGTLLRELPDFAKSRDTLVALYSAMVRCRTFDSKAVALQRTGRLGTYASSLGQEAVGVGVASAMAPTDVFLPSFREHGAQLIRGVTLEELFLFWGGDERGNDFSLPKRDFPVCIPVGTHFPHAAGAALALVHKGVPGVAVAVGGDGATSKGDFYEALNLVGAWNLPAVFVLNNNQWSISVRRQDQTAAQTLAQKAVACGLPGEQVDGNDVIAVREATERALERARSGQGGTLIECVTYRLGDHTTADDASRYRDDDEVSAQWKKEPLVRLRRHLTQVHGWSKADEEALLRTCREEVDQAAENYLATPPEPAGEMLANLFESLPRDLARQAEELGDG